MAGSLALTSQTTTSHDSLIPIIVRLLFLEIGLLHYQPVAALCYDVAECVCETTSRGVNIDCRSHGLMVVPQFGSASTSIHYELNLSGNLIANLSKNTFPKALTFERIVLTDNPLLWIADEAFRGQESTLKELLLSFVSTTQIPSAALRVLSQLELLEIQGYEGCAAGAWGAANLPPHALSAMSNLKDLTLSGSALRYLSQADLAAQTHLVNLSLKCNQLSEIPTAFITQVGNLSRLDLASNQISQVESGRFAGLLNLRALDLSYNPIFSIDRNAFVGLEARLELLSCAYCHLPDASLYALQSLRALSELLIPGNEITSMDDMLAGTRALKVLDIQSNQIAALSKATFKSVANSLEVLDLSKNPLISMPLDTFTALRHLRDLQLNEISGLVLLPAIFVSQKYSLRSLSLKGTSFAETASHWSWIQNLSVLESLVMSSCGIKSVPDFTFQWNTHLSNIDLTGNALTMLTQRSLAGLQFSLNRIVLNSNKLQTLDSCVFYQFSEIDLLKLGLNNNPLLCDCSMLWLYNRLQYITVPVLWHCVDGKVFKTLPHSTFAECPTASPACEDLSPSTITTQTDTISIAVDVVSASCIAVTWVIRADVTATAASVSWQTGAENASVANVALYDNRFEINGLPPATTYVVCVLITITSSMDARACVNAKTGLASNMLSMQKIIGISVGGAVVLALLLVCTVLLAVRISRRRKIRQLVSPPMRGGHTKRFVKPNEDETVDNITGNDSHTGFISQSLDLMTDEEKFRLVNMLTNSSGSLHNMDRSDSWHNSRMADTPKGCKGTKYQTYYLTEQSITDKHVYEEIPDSHYNEIPAEHFEEHDV